MLRETGGDYIRIVGAHDLGGLQFKMDEVERDTPRNVRPRRASPPDDAYSPGSAVQRYRRAGDVAG